jgi:hypothetical protein
MFGSPFPSAWWQAAQRVVKICSPLCAAACYGAKAATARAAQRAVSHLPPDMVVFSNTGSSW